MVRVVPSVIVAVPLVAVGMAVGVIVRMAVFVGMAFLVRVRVIVCVGMPFLVRVGVIVCVGMPFLVRVSVGVFMLARMAMFVIVRMIMAMIVGRRVSVGVIVFVGRVGVLMMMVMPAPGPMRMPVAVSAATGSHGLPTRLQQPAADDDDHQSAHQRQPGEDTLHEEMLRGIESDQAEDEHRSGVRHRNNRSQINSVPDGAARPRQVSGDDGLAVPGRQRVRRPRQKSHAQGDRNESPAWIRHRQQAFELFADGVMPIGGLRQKRGWSQ